MLLELALREQRAVIATLRTSRGAFVLPSGTLFTPSQQGLEGINELALITPFPRSLWS